MIRLKTIEAHNFMSFKHLYLDLSKPGLYLISGFNEKGGDSNGSGKSAILDAICFALWGRTSHGLTWEKAKRWDTQEDLYIKLVLTEGDQEHVIERTNATITTSMDRKCIHKRDAQLSINEMFNTTYELFLASVFFAGGKTDFLASQTDAEKKRIFTPIYRLDKLSKAYDKAKNQFTKCCDEISSWDLHISTRQEAIQSDSITLEACKEKERNWDSEIDTKIRLCEQKIKEISYEVDTQYEKAVQSTRTAYEAIGKLVDARVGFLEVWREELHVALSKQDQNKILSSNAEDALDKARHLSEGVVCEYCGSPLNRKALAKHIKELITKKEQFDLDMGQGTASALDIETKLFEYEELECKLAEAERAHTNAISQLQMAQLEAGSRQERRKDYEALLSEARNSKVNNPHSSIIVALETRIEENEELLVEAKTKNEEVRRKADAYSFLKWVFSKEGVSAFIIERAFGRLESLANRYLGSLSSENFSIEIKPQRELKSKALKEEIDIVIKIGNRKALYWQLSDGQRQRINIALLISLYRLCRDLGINNFDFLLLDEVLDLSLADKGQADTIILMRRLLSSEIHNIFVISHRSEPASDMDFVIETHRDKNGVSTIIGG